MKKLVGGQGILDISCIDSNKKVFKSYKIWADMLARCYSKKSQIRNPTYIGCSVCKEWLIYSNYKQWYDEHCYIGGQVDKDILIKGNMIYSPNTCRFVPGYINSILVSCNSRRGKLPQGISTKNNKRYQVNCCSRGISKFIGSYIDLKDAMDAYKNAKEKEIKIRAEEAYIKREITFDVYCALLAWTIY